MSAVFTGNGLGLFNTSLTQLGASLGGGAGVGQGRNSQLVNLSTGNMVWQSTDEHVVFRGLSVGLNRTYNSLGQLADVGADAWTTGFERRVALLSGTVNTAGSVMRRFTGDGGYQDFAYAGNGAYMSTAGDGAHDTLNWTGTGWSYVEGSTQMQDLYADHADPVLQGRLQLIRQRSSDGSAPVEWQVAYDAQQRISEIRVADGGTQAEALVFGYDAEGRLSSVSTREGGLLRQQVSYSYDSQGRLASVITDLTPDNTADNQWNSSNAAAGNEVGHYRLVPNASGGWQATLQQQSFSLRGELLLSFGEVAMDGRGVRTNVTERRTYDDAGRLIESIRYYPPGSVIRYVDKEGTFMTIDVSARKG